MPALGSLAAEPLYVLVDTAIVGHLGRSQLAALGIAATVLTGMFAIFNFLQYGTTAQVARAEGAGEREAAARLGAQALWLSLAFGIGVAALVVALAVRWSRRWAGRARRPSTRSRTFASRRSGLPAAFLALGGQGYLRGVADLRTPLVIVIAGNVLNVVLEVLFVYGFDWGIEGSAWGTVIAQAAMGAGFVVVVVRRATREQVRPRLALARRLLSVGRWIFVRTAALMSAFVLAGAVATRIGDAAIGAHQVAFQLWIFLALVLDAVAIAGQIIVGRELGAGRPQRAYDASARMIWLSVALGTAFGLVLVAGTSGCARAFTGDGATLDQAARCGRSSRSRCRSRRGVRTRRDPDRRERRPVPGGIDAGRVRRLSARRSASCWPPTSASAASGRRSRR